MGQPVPRRIVALGASNLNRGFHAVVSAGRDEWGRDLEVVAALGHGRSYGSDSTFLCRTLPGILQSGLWSQLASMPAAPTRALVTDVGNDILYGFSPAQILGWVEEAVDRLQRFSDDIILAGLPRVGVNDIPAAKFLFFRSILFPRCRLSFPEVAEAAGRVNAGLAELASARGVRFVGLKPEWYGIDPIHIRPSQWRTAWGHILFGEAASHVYGGPWLEGWRLYLMRPERQCLFGRESVLPQTGVSLQRGARVWLF
jgi:hypothetical protein